MARKPRIEYPGALYHVISRGNQRQSIFLEEKDYQKYLWKLSEYKERYHFLLYAYVLMENHTHLLLETGSIPLSKVMQGINQSFTQYFNRKYNKVGHLFQGRYKAILCDKDSYLLELVRYIHLNPVRIGKVQRPAQYPWSSHQVYLDKKKADWLNTDFILKQFSNKKSKAIEIYNNFILEKVKEPHCGDFYKLKDQRYLGSDDFIEEIEAKQSEKENLDSSLNFSLEQIAKKVCEALTCSFEELFERSSRRKAAHARTIVTYIARKLSNIPLKEISIYFRKDPATLCLGVSKLKEKLHEDNEIEKFIRKTIVDLKKSK